MPKKQSKKSIQEPAKKPALQYGAEQITVLSGLEPVRKRPAMYIGDTGVKGLHHLVWEVIDNSIDEAMGGFCNAIEVRLLANNRVQVKDNGRGIPVERHKQTKKSALETVMTMLHAGGKFGTGGYKVSGGLHGVGVSAVNALSVWTRAEVRRDGKIWAQEYKRGRPLGAVKAKGKASDTGTTITFEPDPEIFQSADFNFDTILQHIRQQAYLTKAVKISVFDERDKAKNLLPYVFYFEGGIRSYVRHLNRNNKTKHDTIFYADKMINSTNVEIALQYIDEYKESVFSFANNITTPEGGSHLAGFRAALTRALNSYARKNEFFKEKDENLSGDDVREGLVAVISVKVVNPQFEGQTKGKLGNPEVKGMVEEVFGEAFGFFLESHPKEAQAILERCVLNAQARKAARVARESVLRKGALEGLTLPGKLADCSSRDPEKCELFIVEGDSAGGSGKQGRRREFQAILPLRGKILNVEKARVDKMLANNEIKSLIVAMGTNLGEQFNIEKLRYHRIIIMSDADSDGLHIRTLLLTLFYRHFPELVKQGHLYIAQPPLYRIQKGKYVKYAYTEDEKLKILKNLEREQIVKGKKIKPESKKGAAREGEEIIEAEVRASIQRYKGLGEMNPEQLWETTMNPESRVLYQVTVEDAGEADEIFDVLMGSEVEPRKKFIQTHAKAVKNLDI